LSAKFSIKSCQDMVDGSEDDAFNYSTWDFESIIKTINKSLKEKAIKQPKF